MPEEPPVKWSNFARDRREDDGDAERRERQVEPREPQRGHAEDEADPAGHGGRDRDRLHVLHAVVRHQDRGRVRADRDEGAVAERDLPGRREQVEAEDRDEVRADRRQLHGAELREHERQHGEHRDPEPERPEPGGHTRLADVSPKSPLGRTSRTPKITASAVASRSSLSIQWM